MLNVVFLGVTILLSLTVFLLLVAETMPPTSDAVPLIGMDYLALYYYWVTTITQWFELLRAHILLTQKNQSRFRFTDRV